MWLFDYLARGKHNKFQAALFAAEAESPGIMDQVQDFVSKFVKRARERVVRDLRTAYPEFTLQPSPDLEHNTETRQRLAEQYQSKFFKDFTNGILELFPGPLLLH